MFGPGVSGGVPNTKALPSVRSFEATPTPFFKTPQYQIKGVTRDSTGAALGTCVVKLFNTGNDIKEQQTISDASGNFAFNVSDPVTTFYHVDYKTGSPDVAGTSKNNLVGT